MGQNYPRNSEEIPDYRDPRFDDSDVVDGDVVESQPVAALPAPKPPKKPRRKKSDLEKEDDIRRKNVGAAIETLKIHKTHLDVDSIKSALQQVKVLLAAAESRNSSIIPAGSTTIGLRHFGMTRFAVNVRNGENIHEDLGFFMPNGDANFDHLENLNQGGLHAVVIDRQVVSGDPLVLWKSPRFNGSIREIAKQSHKWLEKYYPMWRNPSAYWESWVFDNSRRPPRVAASISAQRKAGYTRFAIEVDNYESGYGYGAVIDNEREGSRVIWTTPYIGQNDKDAISNAVEEYLNYYYPEWNDPRAYWTDRSFNKEYAPGIKKS